MSDSNTSQLSLFEAFGVELEYMIVDSAALNVRPIADQLLEAVCGQIQSDFENGPISWSNELALHVIELKTTEPARDLTVLAGQFQQQIRQINQHLQQLSPPARLLPSAMHPWMNPFEEMRLWPHDYSPVYEAFNRIFDCRGHGWANLQSVHLNLPFRGDDEFARLHAAIRLVLPLLPAIAAASPIKDGHLNGLMDNRLDVYRSNAARIPEVVGQVIPEPVYSRDAYQQEILQKLYRAIAPFDPDGILQHEFLNARGAIARFDRGSIEIRVTDIQECPAADLAVVQATVALLKSLVNEQWATWEDQAAADTSALAAVLLRAVRDADQAVMDDPALLRLWGISDERITLNQLWRELLEQCQPVLDDASAAALEIILQRGPLARRISERLPDRENHRPPVAETYRQLADCLQHGQMFVS
ncbi:MAG: hypothetical protein KDA96_02920 [Planctomycetaceae bacterium]|nr:hypothetical protein [Planctomycetaceae bacterium]